MPVTPGGPTDEPDKQKHVQPPEPVPDDDYFGRTVKYLPNGDESRHTVLCGGLIVLGPQPGRLAVTLALLLVPFTLMAIFVFPSTPTPLLVPGVIAFALCIASLLRVATKDPGLVPQRVDQPKYAPPLMDRVQIVRTVGGDDGPKGCCIGGGAVIETRSPLGGAGRATTEYTQSVSDDDVRLREEAMIKYCSTCRRYRGPRTFHCGECNRCIDMYDHHCPWVGTCIGAFNYHVFLWFLFTLQLALFLSLAIVVYTPLRVSEDNDVSIVEALNDLRWIPVVVFAYVVVLGMPATVLTLFHMFLVSTGRLTIEHLRRVYSKGAVNPYDEGCCRNWGRLCGAFHPVALADSFRDVFVKSIELIDTAVRKRQQEQTREPLGRSVEERAKATERELRHEEKHRDQLVPAGQRVPATPGANTDDDGATTTADATPRVRHEVVVMGEPGTPATPMTYSAQRASVENTPNDSARVSARPGPPLPVDRSPAPERVGRYMELTDPDRDPNRRTETNGGCIGQPHVVEDAAGSPLVIESPPALQQSSRPPYASAASETGSSVSSKPLAVVDGGTAPQTPTRLQSRKNGGTPGASALDMGATFPEPAAAPAVDRAPSFEGADSRHHPHLVPSPVPSGYVNPEALAEAVSPAYSDAGPTLVRRPSGVIPSHVVRRSLERLPGSVSPPNSATPRHYSTSDDAR